ncbi:MAG: hypothetical protein ACLTG0_12420 [Oscillibacter sp.]
MIEAHERLLALGYPESELNDLSDEDLLTCLRAERVVIKSAQAALISTTPISRRRMTPST